MTEDWEKDHPTTNSVRSFRKSHPFVSDFLISLVGVICLATVPVILVAGRIFMKQIGLDLEAAGTTYGFYVLVGIPWVWFVYWAWTQLFNLLDPNEKRGTKRSVWTSMRSSFGSTLGGWVGLGLVVLAVVWFVW